MYTDSAHSFFYLAQHGIIEQGWALEVPERGATAVYGEHKFTCPIIDK